MGYDNGTNTVADWANEISFYGTRLIREISSNASPSIRDGVLVIDTFAGNTQGVKLKFYNGATLYCPDVAQANRLIRRKTDAGAGTQVYAYNYVMGNQLP